MPEIWGKVKEFFGGNKEKLQSNQPEITRGEKEEKNIIIDDYIAEATKEIDKYIEELEKAAKVASDNFVNNRDSSGDKQKRAEREMDVAFKRVEEAEKMKIEMTYKIKEELKKLKDIDPEILKNKIEAFNEKIAGLQEKGELNSDDQRELKNYEEEVKKLLTAERLQK